MLSNQNQGQPRSITDWPASRLDPAKFNVGLFTQDSLELMPKDLCHTKPTAPGQRRVVAESVQAMHVAKESHTRGFRSLWPTRC